MTTTSAPVDRRVRVGDQRRRCRRSPRPRRLRVAQHRRVGVKPVGRADPHVHPGGGAAEQQRVGHVVRAVAEVGQGEPGEPAEALADRLQVGEHLAGVELVGERVDDRHRRGRRPSPRSAPAPPVRHTIAVDVAGQHPGGVADGLAAAELAGLRVDDQRGAAELGDAGLERHAGCGWSACRTAPRPPAGPPAAGGANGSAFSASARSRTSACSAGVRSSSRRRCRGTGHRGPPPRGRGRARRRGRRAARRGTRRPGPR